MKLLLVGAGFGVETVVDFFEVGVGDMGVNLGSGDVGMAEHSLDRSQIGAIHEEVGGETMAQGVGRNMLRDAGEFGVFLDNTFNRTGGEAAKIAGDVG